MRVIDIIFGNLLTLYTSNYFVGISAAFNKTNQATIQSSGTVADLYSANRDVHLQKIRLQRHILSRKTKIEGSIEASTMLKNMMNEGVDPWFDFSKF